MEKTYISAQGRIGKIIISRIKPGSELLTEIVKIVKKYKINTGFIPTLLGGLVDTRLISMK